MNTRKFLIAVCLVALSLSVTAGCEQSKAVEGEPAAAPMHMHASASTGDGRQPLYLLARMAAHQLENMRAHLTDVNAVVAGLAAGDMEKVTAAGKRLGPSAEMQMMCNHMGAATPGFTEQALNFHDTAAGIATAAEKGDQAGVLKALDATLETCVSCHATYRQEVVDEDTWTRLTGGEAPQHGH